MFEKLFAESGLSLERLKALLEVGASGSIVRATGGDPVKQSQYSRQIKELEDFFRIKLVERQGKGIRITSNGRELSRISRFFLLGISNFQRGCLAEEQVFRIGASATFVQQFLLPVISSSAVSPGNARYIVEVASGDEIERRLHDLTLDFGITTRSVFSRPLQLQAVGKWHLNLWAPVSRYKNEKSAAIAFKEHRMPLAIAAKELDLNEPLVGTNYDCRLLCDNYLQCAEVLKHRQFAALLPDFVIVPLSPKLFLRVRVPTLESRSFWFRLAWNPRLLRLNPHATKTRDFLFKSLTLQMAA